MRSDRSRLARQVWLYSVVLVGYLAGAVLAFGLIDVTDLGAVFYAPAGITVGALILTPRNRWWIVCFAAASGEIFVDRYYEVAAGPTLGYVAANVAGPLLGASLVRYRYDVPDLARRRDLGTFIGAAVIAGPALGAVIGATTANLADGEPLASTFFEWWLGDGLGVLLVGSAIVATRSSPDRASLRTPEGVALTVGSLALAAVLFWASDVPTGFTLLIPITIAGSRFGTRTVCVLSLAVGSVAAASLAGGGPLIAGLEDSTALVVVKLQFASLVLAGLVIAAESFEREVAVSRIQRATAQATADHELVQRLQLALLPARELDGSGFSATGAYRSAGDHLRIGGDWYDVVELSDGRLFISIGDVVGHGAAAVSVMGQLQFAIAALAGMDLSPGALLEHIDMVARRLDGAFSTTVWVAEYDPAVGRLTYSSAGHPPALIRTESENEWRCLEEAVGPPLAVGRVTHRPNAAVEIEGSAALVLYTDGLVERPGEIIDTGIRRLQTALDHHGVAGPDAIMDRVAEVGPRDDAVLLSVTLRVVPPPSRSIRSDTAEPAGRSSPDFGPDLEGTVDPTDGQQLPHGFPSPGEPESATP